MLILVPSYARYSRATRGDPRSIMLFGFRVCGGSGTYCLRLTARAEYIHLRHLPTHSDVSLSPSQRLSPRRPRRPRSPTRLPTPTPLHSHTGHRTHDTAHTHGAWTHAHTTLDGDLESDTLTTLSTHTSEDTNTAKTTLVDYQWLRRWWRLRRWSWFPEQCLQSCCPSTVPAKR